MYSLGEKIMITLFVLFILGIVLATGFAIWWGFGGQTFQRIKKQWQTQFKTDSIYRELEIIDMNGNVTYQDSGHFDIDYGEGRIKYINNNELKIIYCSVLESVRVIEKEKKDE